MIRRESPPKHKNKTTEGGKPHAVARRARHSPARRTTTTTTMQAITMRAAPAMSGVKLSTTAPRRATTTTTPAHAARRTSVHALAAAVDQLTFDGAKSGSSTLELKTARAEVAKGLVHKYVVMVRQNARRVRARAIAYARASTMTTTHAIA